MVQPLCPFSTTCRCSVPRTLPAAQPKDPSRREDPGEFVKAPAAREGAHGG